MKKNLLLAVLNFALLTLNCPAQNKNIDSLLILIKSDKADTNKVNHLFQLALECELIGNYEKGLSFGTEELELAVKLDFKKGIAKASNLIGNIYLGQANYPRALEFFLKALSLNEGLKNKKGMAGNLGNIGIVYWNQNDYPKALDYNFKALKTAEEIGDKKGIASDLGNIALVYQSQSNYSMALDYYLRALKIAEKIGQKQLIAIDIVSIGKVYAAQKAYPKALDYYLRALKMAKEQNSKKGIAVTLSSIGSLYIKMGKFKDAEQYLKSAITLDDNTGALDGLMFDEKKISQLYDSIGNYKLSLEYYKKATALKDTIFSQENKKQLIRKEMNYEFDKKETAAKAAQDVKDAVTKADKKKQLIIIWSTALGLLLVIVFAGFIFRSLRITRKQKQIIELQKDEVSKQKDIAEELRELSENQKHVVEEKQKEIIQSITYAKRIQTALLTSDKYINNHLPAEHFILFKPKDIVSGDFYWALSIAPFANWDIGTNKIKLHRDTERQNIFYMITADCTGHGVPGAFMSMLNISYLNENVIERSIRLPHDILNAQRKEIIQALNPEGSTDESKDGMDCILCAYDFDKMLLHFASANNPLWLIREKSSEFKVENSELSESNSKLNTQNFELIEYKADKMPVGKYSEKTEPFTLNTIELQKGDIIYTSTDGFADQFGSNGKKLMKKKFKEELLKIHQQPMAEQKEYLNQFFESWKGSNEQVDDVCIIGVKI